MKFIIMPRGYGKSAAACREAVRLGCPILTAVHHKDYYLCLCKKLGLPPVRVRSVQDLIDHNFASSYVVVDEVDSVLKQLLKAYGIIPTLGTMSLEDQHWPNGGDY